MAETPEWALKAADRIVGFCSHSPEDQKRKGRAARRVFADIIATEHAAAEGKGT